MKVLENLEPKSVFRYFEEICNIPHGSQNLDGISSYLQKFATDRGLFCIRDEANNIIIVKEASKGYENVEPIILQGHMDMVAVKKNDCDINLDTDPLRLKVDGDFVYAEGTSLGGDDGIAVAYVLAILDDDSISHPKIEAVITTDEEIGMEGATAIDLSMLTAKRMMNIDSEEEGIILTSCAGGARVDCNIPFELEQKKGTVVTVSISGLTGGHSGTEINKERVNAIKLLGRVLKLMSKKMSLSIIEIAGGEKDNAIPREAYAKVVVDNISFEEFKKYADTITSELKNELVSKEKNIDIKLDWINQVDGISGVCEKDSISFIDFLTLLPNGIQAMSTNIEGLVETSLNVGILQMGDKCFTTSSAVRSSIETAKANLIEQLNTLTTLVGGNITVHGEYPGWQFNPDSKLRALMEKKYKEMFNKEVEIQAIHAGLECGIMISKIPGLDCVSFGPNMYDIHTTEEKLSISSTERMWRFILEVLKEK